MGIVVYITTVTGSREIKSQQCELMRILDSKNIKYETIDISVDNNIREEMRQKAGDPKAFPPQVFNGDKYCGDFPKFSAAVEEDILDSFLAA
ncbi:SH3 domain-binding glutamic acid-rich-like protein 3 [Bombina bombina]|uniref:SH3 domain-binding glutamic acid-rich-like protein 3 n=1 Tax=Bombina bombina TaxID=8345 RepID=UPI00235A5FBE|nr:SH3 domain-binding glutamic acid-rich-like protein 3 [Bombina bombina]